MSNQTLSTTHPFFADEPAKKTPLVAFMNDDKSVISDITEANDATESETISSAEFLQKFEEIKAKTESELSKMTMDKLKEKCKELSIANVSTQKKTELVQTLLTEFMKLWQALKDKKRVTLKSLCKIFDIKGAALLKKDEMVIMILNHCSSNMRFRVDESSAPPVPPPVQEEPKLVTEKVKKISKLEELERQRTEIENKLKEETDRQTKLAEEEKQKNIEEEKKREKEEAKKKKQAIPKHVRNIVWNHYIGEDIIKHKCLCCKKVTITNTNFEVGHVLSETNGGTHEINNLRPICGACNHSMGTENMVDYVVKYGLFIG